VISFASYNFHFLFLFAQRMDEKKANAAFGSLPRIGLLLPPAKFNFETSQL
jgi:hypothetical protein